MLGEEPDDPLVAADAVRELEHVVPLVLEHEVVDRLADASQVLDEVVRLPLDDAGVVLSLDDEERARDRVDVRPRRVPTRKSRSRTGSPTASAKYGFHVSGIRSMNVNRSYGPNMSTAPRQSSGCIEAESMSVMYPPYRRPTTPARDTSTRSSSGSTSVIACTWSSRSRPPQSQSTRFMYSSPYLVEPRALGTNTAKPSRVSDWTRGIENQAKFGRSWLWGLRGRSTREGAAPRTRLG